MIQDLISRLPDEDACLELLSRFDKLLKKYANMLGYDDAFEELRLFFLELIYTLPSRSVSDKGDGCIVKYISNAVRNHYIYLSKQHGELPVLLSEVSEEQRVHIEYMTAQTSPAKLSEFFW